jgi:two-component system chemotaxis response regulator CheY
VDCTVLVIEDSPVIQRLIEVCLTPAGFQIETADDGEAGIAAARELKPEVVVLDVGLPVMDGWQVLNALQADPETVDIRVLVLTAHAQDELRAQATGAGAAGFLTKPFRPDDLRAAVVGLAPTVAAGESRTA